MQPSVDFEFGTLARGHQHVHVVAKVLWEQGTRYETSILLSEPMQGRNQLSIAYRWPLREKVPTPIGSSTASFTVRSRASLQLYQKARYPAGSLANAYSGVSIQPSRAMVDERNQKLRPGQH